MAVSLVWFRNDLRLADNPALASAAKAGGVVPVFVLDNQLLRGKRAGANRLRFLHESLQELDGQFQQQGGRLAFTAGPAGPALIRLAQQTGAGRVVAATDFSPHARRRDERVAAELDRAGIGLNLLPGRLMLDDAASLRTGAGRPYQIFTPFYRAWLEQPRRPVLPAPEQLRFPSNLASLGGGLPSLQDWVGRTTPSQLADHPAPGGEAAAHNRLRAFLEGPVRVYHNAHDDLAADATSRLSAYLHFGCLSPRTVEAALPGSGDGPTAFRRQLAWRDFYHYVLANFPHNTHQEFQARYRRLAWSYDEALFRAWTTGRTGYPLVDAAMRQLNAEGYMHNRARLVVGSFLTKDLGIDWRWGERYFMQQLIDGDVANNNGNWQWIASVGVDPAPLFRRLYNPTSQLTKFDPTGAYVRRYVPELRRVPLQRLAEPWRMTPDEQALAGCHIGLDYPAPIVDHARARLATIERYRAVES